MILSGTGSNAYRNGTCYTSSECTEKGGIAQGTCAAGFGVCCVFLVSASGGTISQNCTYVQNPGFPSTYGDTAELTYTVYKCSAGKEMVCLVAAYHTDVFRSVRPQAGL